MKTIFFFLKKWKLVIRLKTGHCDRNYHSDVFYGNYSQEILDTASSLLLYSIFITLGTVIVSVDRLSGLYHSLNLINC